MQTQRAERTQPAPASDRAREVQHRAAKDARATVGLPVGVFLLIAAIKFNPNRAKGLDGELVTLARYGWGRVVLFAVALGLLVFALFSFLDARFHDFETD